MPSSVLAGLPMQSTALLTSSYGYLPPSVVNHKSVSVMVWMEDVV